MTQTDLPVYTGEEPAIPEPETPQKQNAVTVRTPDEVLDLMGWVNTLKNATGHPFAGDKQKYDLLLILRTCQDLGIPFTMGLTGMYIVKNRVRLHSELPMAIVRMSGKMTSYREYVVDDKGKEINLQNLAAKAFAGVCETKRVGSDEVYQTIFTVNDAKEAGLFVKDTWQKYLKRMLKARARTENLSYNFADVLMGMTDDDKGGAPNMRDVTGVVEMDTRDKDDLTAAMANENT